METETSTQPSPENTETPAAPDLKTVIETSKATIAAAQAKKTPGKRGPKPKIKAADAAPASPSATAQTSTTVSETHVVSPPPVLVDSFKQPIKFLSKLPAAKFQIPELAFDDDEALATAQALDQVVQAFVPDVGKMDPKTAAVLGVFSVVGSIGVQKYMIYRDVMAKRSPEPEAKTEVKTTPDAPKAAPDDPWAAIEV